MSFHFRGPIEASKSLMNRALVIGSFFPNLDIRGVSHSRDVELMRAAVAQLRTGGNNLNLDCGEAGTVIRFLAFRVARLPGRHELRGSPRLLARPLTEIRDGLEALGVKVSLHPGHIHIEGDGWRKPAGPLVIHRGRSSQFPSAVLLSAWNLEFDLDLRLDGPALSEAYWQMTLQQSRDLGLEVRGEGDRLHIPAGQKTTAATVEVEADASSAFAIAAMAALDGRAEFTNLPSQSLQPDHQFLSILETMGASVHGQTVAKGVLRGIEANLETAPDLFPVLATLCAFADGPSRLYGAPHLKHKESDRLEKTWELLDRAGVPTEKLADGLVIAGQGMDFVPRAFSFNPDEDHRMAMAAALLARRNPALHILHPEVVNKSFPHFWRLLQEATA